MGGRIRLFLRNPRRVLTLMMAITLLAVFLFFCYTYTRPTQLTFRVYDAEKKAVLPDSLVEVQNANGQTIVQLITDETGWAGVKRLTPGTGYRAVARHIDYVPAERRNLQVQSNKTIEVAIPLRPKPGGRLYVGTEYAYVAAIDTSSYLFVAFKKAPESLGRWPIRQVALHPNRPRLYITARYGSYVLDEVTLEPITALPITGTVESFAASQTGGQLLTIALTGALEGSVEEQAGVVTKTAESLPSPREQFIAVANNSGTRLVVLDSEAIAVERTIGMSFPSSLARVILKPSRQTTQAYVLDSVNRHVWVINMQTGEVVRRIPVRFRPTWAALSLDERYLFVGGADTDRLTLLDTQTWEIGRTLFVGQGMSAIALHPTGREIYLANTQLGLLTILDGQTLESLADVPVGRKPVAIVVDSRGERVYVANADSHDISVLDVSTRQIVETIDVQITPFSLSVR